MICGMLILQIKADPILMYCFESKTANNQKGLMCSTTKTQLQLMFFRRDLHLIHLAGVGSLLDSKVGKWRVAREASLSEICLVNIEAHRGGFSFRVRGLEGLKVLHLAWMSCSEGLTGVGFSRGYEEDFYQCHYTENFAHLCPNQ
jgi:hypothetical protein